MRAESRLGKQPSSRMFGINKALCSTPSAGREAESITLTKEAKEEGKSYASFQQGEVKKKKTTACLFAVYKGNLSMPM